MKKDNVVWVLVMLLLVLGSFVIGATSNIMGLSPVQIPVDLPSGPSTPATDTPYHTELTGSQITSKDGGQFILKPQGLEKGKSYNIVFTLKEGQSFGGKSGGDTIELMFMTNKGILDPAITKEDTKTGPIFLLTKQLININEKLKIKIPAFIGSETNFPDDVLDLQVVDNLEKVIYNINKDDVTVATSSIAGMPISIKLYEFETSFDKAGNYMIKATVKENPYNIKAGVYKSDKITVVAPTSSAEIAIAIGSVTNKINFVVSFDDMPESFPSDSIGLWLVGQGVEPIPILTQSIMRQSFSMLDLSSLFYQFTIPKPELPGTYKIKATMKKDGFGLKKGDIKTSGEIIIGADGKGTVTVKKFTASPGVIYLDDAQNNRVITLDFEIEANDKISHIDYKFVNAPQLSNKNLHPLTYPFDCRLIKTCTGQLNLITNPPDKPEEGEDETLQIQLVVRFDDGTSYIVEDVKNVEIKKNKPDTSDRAGDESAPAPPTATLAPTTAAAEAEQKATIHLKCPEQDGKYVFVCSDTDSCTDAYFEDDQDSDYYQIRVDQDGVDQEIGRLYVEGTNNGKFEFKYDSGVDESEFKGVNTACKLLHNRNVLDNDQLTPLKSSFRSCKAGQTMKVEVTATDNQKGCDAMWPDFSAVQTVGDNEKLVELKKEKGGGYGKYAYVYDGGSTGVYFSNPLSQGVYAQIMIDENGVDDVIGKFFLTDNKIGSFEFQFHEDVEVEEYAGIRKACKLLHGEKLVYTTTPWMGRFRNFLKYEKVGVKMQIKVTDTNKNKNEQCDAMWPDIGQSPDAGKDGIVVKLTCHEGDAYFINESDLLSSLYFEDDEDSDDSGDYYQIRIDEVSWDDEVGRLYVGGKDSGKFIFNYHSDVNKEGYPEIIEVCKRTYNEKITDERTLSTLTKFLDSCGTEGQTAYFKVTNTQKNKESTCTNIWK